MRRLPPLVVCALVASTTQIATAQDAPAAAAPAAAAPAAATAATAATVKAIDEGATFVPTAPKRVLDTRTAGTGPVEDALGLDLSWTLPDTATAVVLNLTAVRPTEATHVRVSPYGQQAPAVSSLNVGPGEIRANQVTATLSAHREVLLTNNAGTVHLVADLAGYYVAEHTASRFTPTTPARVLDTRGSAPLGQGGTREVDLSGRVPASATSVVVNLTGVLPSTDTHVTAFPAGTARPDASSVNLTAGQITPNLVTVALGAGRRIALHNNQGSTHLAVDLVGHYAADRGHLFFPVTAFRALDTRLDGGPVGAGRSRGADLSTRLPASAAAVVVNLTGTGATADTHVTAFATGTPEPATSNLNLVPGRDTANGAVVATGGDALVSLRNNAGSTDLVLDVSGFFATPPGCAADCVHGWGGTRNGVARRYGATPSPRPWLSGVASAVSGARNSYAVLHDGTVRAWGDNSLGQLGTGATGGDSEVPLPVAGLTGVTAVAAGDGTAYALGSDGTVWAWGDGSRGQLGVGRHGSDTPVRVSGLTGVTAVAAAGDAAFALGSDGALWGWGGSAWAFDPAHCPGVPTCAVGQPARIAVPLPAGTRVTAVAGSDGDNAYALRSDGTAWAWGQNSSGELGAATPQGNWSRVPVQVTGLTGVVSIDGGANSAHAVTSDGAVWAWGVHHRGELGTGTPCPEPSSPCVSRVPVRVAGLTGPVVVDGGAGTVLAVKPDGAVWSWGGNGHDGNLGDGTSAACSYPVAAPCVATAPVRTLLPGASAVAAGRFGQYAVVP
ncbi:RCC1 domain-containing protein [Saccharothrix sp. Mg75]|uniref:RCC1 domain-containing protein n=1 Tax=Saccharothrix sp. Mg75 TaxID=3445357 RepID=UPI003EED118A